MVDKKEDIKGIHEIFNSFVKQKKALYSQPLNIFISSLIFFLLRNFFTISFN